MHLHSICWRLGSYHQLGPICAPDVVYLSDYKKGWVVIEQIMTLSTYIIYVLSFSINFVYIWQMHYSSRVKVWEVWSHKQVIEVYELTKIWLCFPLFLNSVRAWVLDLRYWVQMLPLPYFPICNTNRIWIFINNNWKNKKPQLQIRVQYPCDVCKLFWGLCIMIILCFVMFVNLFEDSMHNDNIMFVKFEYFVASTYSML